MTISLSINKRLDVSFAATIHRFVMERMGHLFPQSWFRFSEGKSNITGTVKSRDCGMVTARPRGVSLAELR